MKRIGKCQRCGACCIVTKIAGYNDKDFMAVFGEEGKPCKHLIIKNGIAGCAIYKNRPYPCRSHPLTPADAVQTCSFKFIIAPFEFQELAGQQQPRMD